MNGIKYWLHVAAWFLAVFLVAVLHIVSFILSIPARLVGVACVVATKWMDDLSAPKGA